jgi:YD repeat-containing protein
VLHPVQCASLIAPYILRLLRHMPAASLLPHSPRLRLPADDKQFRSRVTKALRTNLPCDSRGKVLTNTDAENRLTQYQYDALGRLTRRIDPLAKAIQYAFDALDHRVKPTLAGPLSPFKTVHDSQHHSLSWVMVRLSGSIAFGF